MINAVSPGTIPENNIKIKAKGLMLFEINENLELALKYVPQLGIKVVNMGPEDFTQGKVIF